MKKYWQSLDQLNETPEFLDSAKNEFAENVPTSALGRKGADVHKAEESANDVSRRDFLKFMGFSVGAATLAACETPVNKTIPYVIKPEEITPGIANWYASTYFDGHDYCSVLVKTREGRPIKVDGNKKSPITRGGSSARVQASVLSLYDSARLKGAMKGSESVSWEKADDEITRKLNDIAASGKSISILTSTVISPSTKQIFADFKSKYPSANVVTYDAVSYYAIAKANGGVIPSYRFDKANVVVSFSADFLANWLSPVEYASQYAQGRKLTNGKKQMLKHIQFETTLSLTGSNADIRVPLKPSQIGTAAVNLYNALAVMAGETGISASGNVAESEISDCAKWLWENKGRSLVVCGVNDIAVQTVVSSINKLLGNYESTIDVVNHSNCHQGNDDQFSALIKSSNEGKIGALIIYNSNPAYTSSGFADVMKNVGLKISFSSSLDETAVLCDYILPDHHYLEAWNDAEPQKGYLSLSQPTIHPIYTTRAAQESLLKWAGNNTDYYSYIQNHWSKNLFPGISDFTALWNKSLHDGVAELPPSASKENKSEYPNISLSEAAAIIAKEKEEGIELIVYEKPGIGIGNQYNNPWLHELPDPMSKCTWDNYLTMNPTDMKGKYSMLERGNNKGDVVEISINGRKAKAPVFPQPGQALGTVGIALGYGRADLGKVAKEAGGVDAYQFMQWKNGTIQTAVSSVSLNSTGEKHEFACTQTHHTIMGRDNLIRETNLQTYSAQDKSVWNPPVTIPIRDKDGKQRKAAVSEIDLWDKHEKPGHHWGLAIDMNSCIGCGSCVVSCTAENNVPVVGKREVINVREMHWLRIDRYYSTDIKKPEKGRIIGSYRDMESPSENPRVTFQPVMCQHCNHAPCETVCPVLATTHSNEGVNQMIYNRCIGTRYCANNCPYKVRRYNWFQYDSNKMFADVNPASWGNDLGRMVLNPDIVVRSRGVMEKCTLCVQRAQEGKLNAKKEERKLKDGDIETACQSACPANAIVFGDFNDPESQLSQLYKDDRRFLLLEEIGIQPNVFYMTKVRNA